MCSSQKSIPLLAQMGAVELHTWGSRMPRPECRGSHHLRPRSGPDAAVAARARSSHARARHAAGTGVAGVPEDEWRHGPARRGAARKGATARSRRCILAPRRRASRAPRYPSVFRRNEVPRIARAASTSTGSAISSPRRPLRRIRRATGPECRSRCPSTGSELGKTDIRGAHFNLRNVAARVAAQGDAWAALPPITPDVDAARDRSTRSTADGGSSDAAFFHTHHE